ncbi:MAG: Flp family type IVb pilin [Pseudomonadota bacterium]
MTHTATLLRLLRDERGATAIEYSLLCALIFFMIITTVQGVADETNTMWTRVGTTMQQASS